MFKAAPRFELGIKDLQSSALPLGHAAEDKSYSLIADRISQSAPCVLFLCNGHGEDVIALRILESLHERNPALRLEVLPLVGEGKVFELATLEGWLFRIGPTSFLPSGGFSNQSFRGLLADISSGLLKSLWRNWMYIKWAAFNGRKIIAVGDMLPLLLAWMSRTDYGFIGTPKSDYTWTSGPGWLLSDFYHRLKGTEWDPWECYLMRSSRCKFIAVRDKLTARRLRNCGVLAYSPGNPMMDGFLYEELPKSLSSFRRLMLLCGSRMPEALKNFRRLLNASMQLNNSSDIAIFIPLVNSIPIFELEEIVSNLGFRLIESFDDYIGANSCWRKDSIFLFFGVNKFVNWSTWAEVGLANAGTATEQLVGLGVPCLSLPGTGPQFKKNFAVRQSRLLGGAVLSCSDAKSLITRVQFLLDNDSLRLDLARIGSQRMGLPGGSKNLAKLISSFMLEK